MKAPGQLLCRLADLPDGGSRELRCPIDGGGLIALRRGRRVWLYRNQCPHLGLELDWVQDQFLDHSGQFIQCATHGALFEIDTGLCVAGPCVHQRLIPVPCSLRGDQVLLERPPPAPLKDPSARP